MSIYITTECINCGACEPECPNTAIYAGGSDWTYGGDTFGDAATPSGATGFWSADYYYVVPDKCTECKGFYDSPKCAEVCPVDCCLTDPNHVEDEATLLTRKEKLDSMGR